MATTCGFCNGTGRVANRQADRYGPRPDYPMTCSCPYCGGVGACEDGDKLLPQDAARVYRADDEDRRRAGLPPWA